MNAIAAAALIFGVSLTYDPAIEINGHVRVVDHHVLIESFLSGSTIPERQWILPYLHGVYAIDLRYGQDVFHTAGLKATYAAYGDNVTDELKILVPKVEKQLARPRTATFLETRAGFTDTLGFVRVFDASIYVPGEGGVRGYTDATSPFELMMQMRDRPSPLIDYLRQGDVDVYEVGKYYLSPLLTIDELKQVRGDIARWLFMFIENLGVERRAKMIFTAHVASRSQEVVNRRDFGFQLLDRKWLTTHKNFDPGPDFNQNLFGDERLLVVTGTDLYSEIKKHWPPTR